MYLRYICTYVCMHAHTYVILYMQIAIYIYVNMFIHVCIFVCNGWRGFQDFAEPLASVQEVCCTASRTRNIRNHKLPPLWAFKGDLMKGHILSISIESPPPVHSAPDATCTLRGLGK